MRVIQAPPLDANCFSVQIQGEIVFLLKFEDLCNVCNGNNNVGVVKIQNGAFYLETFLVDLDSIVKIAVLI